MTSSVDIVMSVSVDPMTSQSVDAVTSVSVDAVTSVSVDAVTSVSVDAVTSVSVDVHLVVAALLAVGRHDHVVARARGAPSRRGGRAARRRRRVRGVPPLVHQHVTRFRLQTHRSAFSQRTSFDSISAFHGI